VLWIFCLKVAALNASDISHCPKYIVLPYAILNTHSTSYLKLLSSSFTVRFKVHTFMV